MNFDFSLEMSIKVRHGWTLYLSGLNLPKWMRVSAVQYCPSNDLNVPIDERFLLPRDMA